VPATSRTRALPSRGASRFSTDVGLIEIAFVFTVSVSDQIGAVMLSVSKDENVSKRTESDDLMQEDWDDQRQGFRNSRRLPMLDSLLELAAQAADTVKILAFPVRNRQSHYRIPMVWAKARKHSRQPRLRGFVDELLPILLSTLAPSIFAW
jgi:hypothetical protein